MHIYVIMVMYTYLCYHGYVCICMLSWLFIHIYVIMVMSKVMVGSSGGKMNVNSRKWPCGVYGKGVQANSVQCTVCKNGFTNGAVVCVVTCRG